VNFIILFAVSSLLYTVTYTLLSFKLLNFAVSLIVHYLAGFISEHKRVPEIQTLFCLPNF